MYLPKHQYVIKKVSELGDVGGVRDQVGNVFNQLNKQVVLTSTGEIFDTLGINFNKGDFSKAISLFTIPSTEKAEEDQNNTTFLDNGYKSSSDKVKSVKLPPTSLDLQNGVMRRCFYKNTSTGKVKEISKYEASKLAGNRQRYESVLCVDWLIKGPAKDQTLNGYLLEGIESKNKKTLEDLKQVMSGVETVLMNPLEFVQDTLPVKNPVIQKQNIDIVIPSPGKRL